MFSPPSLVSVFVKSVPYNARRVEHPRFFEAATRIFWTRLPLPRRVLLSSYNPLVVVIDPVRIRCGSTPIRHFVTGSALTEFSSFPFRDSESRYHKKSLSAASIFSFA